jgi:tRNA threonylcarbamoyladenosine biosynthesis protein TsaB
MKILAIDTSADACSAALLIGDEIEQCLERQPRRHGELVLAMMERLLAAAGIGLAQLDALAFGRGPGSFTGVRIAASVVQGVAFAADLPVVPVSTLTAMAQGHFRSFGMSRIIPALDARMGELYWGPCRLGEGDIMRSAGAEEVASAEMVWLPEGDGWSGIGSGWAAYGDLLRARMRSRLLSVITDTICESHDVAVLAVTELAEGRYVSAEQALPVYLRNRVTASPPDRGSAPSAHRGGNGVLCS